MVTDVFLLHFILKACGSMTGKAMPTGLAGKTGLSGLLMAGNMGAIGHGGQWIGGINEADNCETRGGGVYISHCRSEIC